MSISLVEFLAPVKKKTRLAQVASVLYWFERYGAKESMVASEIKSALTRSRVPNAANVNVAAVLLAGGSWVDTPENDPHGVKLWQLTETGRKEVRAIHGLPEEEVEIAHSVSDLQKVAAKIADPSTKAYIEEAILCVSVGALRAAIVFIWVGAIAELKDRIWSKGKSAVNASITSRNANAKPLAKKDDLVKINEAELLNVAEDVGVIDKAEHKILAQALDTRNQCGHPNKYDPGVAKVKSHVEDIAGVLWV